MNVVSVILMVLLLLMTPNAFAQTQVPHSKSTQTTLKPFSFYFKVPNRFFPPITSKFVGL